MKPNRVSFSLCPVIPDFRDCTKSCGHLGFFFLYFYIFHFAEGRIVAFLREESNYYENHRQGIKKPFMDKDWVAPVILNPLPSLCVKFFIISL